MAPQITRLRTSQSLEVTAFTLALEEIRRIEREAVTRRFLLVRAVFAIGWLAFAWGFRDWPVIGASLPPVLVYAGLSLVLASLLWRSPNQARAWFAVPLLDVPAMGFAVWRMLPFSPSPMGEAGLTLGTFFVMLIISERSLLRPVVWMTSAFAAVAETALLWRAGFPQAAPAAALCLGLGTIPLLRGSRLVRQFFTRLVGQHATLERFGRFHSPDISHQVSSAVPGASPDDCPVSLVFAELHLATDVPDEAAGAAPLEEAIASFDAAAAPIILRHGGTPDHSASAGLALYFLRTAARGDDAARAVQCALDLVAALRPLNHQRELQGKPALALGLGIHSGWAAVDRSQGPGELVVLGNAVGVAALLSRRGWTAKAPVLASPETRVRATSGFTWAAAGSDAFVVGPEPTNGGGAQRRLIG